jgi:hypothetical protein
VPGIESYGRGKRAGNSGTEKVSVRADELAQIFFSKTVADAATFLDSYNDDFRQCSSFRPDDFERQKFLYLVASVAIVLTEAAQKQDSIIEVIAVFRSRVRLLMQRYWGDTEEECDSQVEEAASDFASLVFTNPDEERGLSIDWAQTWLRRVGIEEHNPITLLEISHTWKSDYLCNVKIIASMEVVGTQPERPGT